MATVTSPILYMRLELLSLALVLCTSCGSSATVATSAEATHEIILSGTVCEGTEPSVVRDPVSGTPEAECRVPLAGASVLVANSSGRWVGTDTDSRGRFNLQALPVAGLDDDYFFVSADGHAPLKLRHVAPGVHSVSVFLRKANICPRPPQAR